MRLKTLLTKSTLILTLAFVAWAAPADASPTFPGELTGQLDLKKFPACTLCHVGTPGWGTADSLFALSMRERGLLGAEPDTLLDALEAMAQDKVDSDGDGVEDLEELRLGENPNAIGRQLEPEYGCGGRIQNRSRPSGLLLLLLPLAVLLRRRA